MLSLVLFIKDIMVDIQTRIAELRAEIATTTTQIEYADSMQYVLKIKLNSLT